MKKMIEFQSFLRMYGKVRELVVELFGLVWREEDWVIGWLVKEREKGIKGREGHYRNFTITYHSYLSPG